jgi:hypothetical protein
MEELGRGRYSTYKLKTVLNTKKNTNNRWLLLLFENFVKLLYFLFLTV